MPPDTRLDATGFQDMTGVSRETCQALTRYAALLRKWQSRINLVGSRTLPDLWRRHLLDSWQILHFARQVHGRALPQTWLDLGSGAGFPGLVLALCGAGAVDLVESDRRKCAFLGQVIRATGAPARVVPARIEALDPVPVAAITARAVAPLARLAEYAYPFVDVDTEIWALKGRAVDNELDALDQDWRYNIDRFDSLSDPGGTVLRLTGLTRKEN